MDFVNVLPLNLFYLKGLIGINTICKPRNSGRTTELVRLSAEKSIPILCMGTSVARICQIANELGVIIPHPIAIQDYVPNAFKNVLVDNAEYVLQYLLGTNVECIAVCTN